MADFKLFEPMLLKREGGYTNDPADTGGETWEGISRNNYPKWSGWALVDAAKNLAQFPAILRTDQALQAMVDKFYKCEEWDVIQGDKINNQSIANFLADWEVNAGDKTAVKHLQEVLCFTDVEIDGKMGPKTLFKLNANSCYTIFVQLQQSREQFYRDVVVENPHDKKYLAGWLARNKSFTFAES